MKILIFILIPLISFADIEELIFKDYTDLSPKYDKSHFVFHSDISLITYKSENQLKLTKSDIIKKDDSKVYWGPSIGIGRRFFLNSRFSVSAHVDGFYYLNNKTDERTYSEEFDRAIYESKDKNHMYGARTYASLYYRGMFKSLYFEPFITVGIGYSKVRNEVDYSYDDLVNKESYVAKVDEQLSTLFYGVGLNILSKSGLGVYFKVNKNAITIGESKIRTTSIPYGASESSPDAQRNDDDLDVSENRDEFAYSIGFGYIF